MEKPSLRILVVDDFVPMRNFICAELKNIPEIQVVVEASNGMEAVERAQELRPDLVLLDIELPKLNGFKAAQQILKFSPHSRILFLSQEQSLEFIQEAHAVGGKGFVAKMHIGRSLLTAVKAVLRGETAFMAGFVLASSAAFAN